MSRPRPFVSIIRIALRLLLSSVAFGPCAIAIFARCNVDPVSYLPSGWHQPSHRDSLVTRFVSHVNILCLITKTNSFDAR